MARSPRDGRANETIGGMARMAEIGELLTSVDRERIAEICRRFGVAELLVFGSQARGDAADGSDVDLAYTLAPGRHLGFAVNRLEDELSEVFGQPVDLVSRAALHRLIRDDALAGAQVLYAA